MKILDTSTINYILKSNLSLKEKYYVTPDVKEESEMAELIVGNKVPPKVLEISKESSFSMATFLENYKEMLNKYRGRSFYNMTGFGDISILALLKTEIEVSEAKTQKSLPGMEESLVVYTQDNGLVKRMNKEFDQYVKKGRVKVSDYTKIK